LPDPGLRRDDDIARGAYPDIRRLLRDRRLRRQLTADNSSEPPPMKIRTKPFRAGPGDEVDLKKWPTRIDPVYAGKDDYKALLDQQVKELSELQQKLFATRRHALLVVIQATDAAGKDGAIRHVMSGVNPQGCAVTSFGRPSAEEMSHDFLWRSAKVLPARGMIALFNRSYYEEVLVVRMHPNILQAQGLPEDVIRDEGIWSKRLRSIRDHEQHLTANGTSIVKIMLHVSKDEQKKRLLERIDDPAKNWKSKIGDVAERKLWKQYRKAFEEAISATSTKDAPWYIVPADDALAARLYVSEIISDALKAMDLSMPEPSPERIAELKETRKALESE
jgi:PPK2 family polyphosphate:nucleotide phosphotransferase